MVHKVFTGVKNRARMGYSAYFTLRSDATKKDGTKALIMRVLVNGKKMDISMGISLFDKQWRAGKIVRHPHGKDFNLVIGKSLATANEIFIEYRLMGKPLTLETFRKEYHNPDARKDFLIYFEQEMWKKFYGEEIREGTLKKHKTVLKKLKEWHPGLKFCDLTVNSIREFDGWHLRRLRSAAKRNRRPLKKDGWAARINALKAIKSYLKLALKDGVRMQNPFETYKIKRLAPALERLEQEELSRMMKVGQLEWMLDVERDVLEYFLFACMTGLRYCEIAVLGWQQVGKDMMEIRDVKLKSAHRSRKVPLSSAATQYLPERRDRGLVFPVISNQKTNFHLKTLARRARIDKPISFKYARATFASIFSEEQGSPKALQEILGHASITTSMRYYVDVTDRQKIKEVGVFDKFMIAND